MSKVIFTHLILCILAGSMAFTGNPDDPHYPVSSIDAFMELTAQNTPNLIHKKQTGYSGENRDGNTPGTDHPLSSHHIHTYETEFPEEEIFLEQVFQVAGTYKQHLRLADFSGALKPVYSNPFYDPVLSSLTTIVLLH